MVDVAGVEVGAVVEEERGDLDGGCEVEGELAIAAAGVDELGVGGEELADAVDHAEAGCGVDIEDGAAGDEIVGEVGGGGVEHAEAAGPPARACVDVGAGGEEYVDEVAAIAIHSGDDGWGVEVQAGEWVI